MSGVVCFWVSDVSDVPVLVKSALQKCSMVSVELNVWCFTAEGWQGGFEAVHDNQSGGHISMPGSVNGVPCFWVGKGNVHRFVFLA